MILPLLTLLIAIACYSISQLCVHKKLKWTKDYFGFWGEDMDKRKYKKNWDNDPLGYDRYPAPDNLYYKYIAKVKYKERWFTSTWLTISFTDGYHLCQSLSFIFLALTLALLYDISYIVYIWLLIVGAHSVFYRIFSK